MEKIYLDSQVMSMTGLSQEALKPAKRALTHYGFLKTRGRHGVNFLHEELDLLKKMIEARKLGIKKWSDALIYVLEHDDQSDFKHAVTVAMEGDDTSAYAASKILNNADLSDFAVFMQQAADILSNRGLNELGDYINQTCDIVSEAAAFALTH